MSPGLRPPARFLLALALAAAVGGCGVSRAGHGHGHGHAPGGGAAGHGHARFDDAELWAPRFEDPARDAWQKPGRVLEALDLRPDSRVADIGAATGYFPVRIAPRVPRGRVWGVDIEPSMVRYLARRAEREGLANLFAILGTPDDPLLPEPVDRVLLVDTVHHVEGRREWFARLRGTLRPGARVVIVDFRKGDMPVGPPDHAKLSPAEVESELVAAGYRCVDRDESSLPWQWILVFAPEGR